MRQLLCDREFERILPLSFLEGFTENHRLLLGDQGWHPLPLSVELSERKGLRSLYAQHIGRAQGAGTPPCPPPCLRGVSRPPLPALSHLDVRPCVGPGIVLTVGPGPGLVLLPLPAGLRPHLPSPPIPPLGHDPPSKAVHLRLPPTLTHSYIHLGSLLQGGAGLRWVSPLFLLCTARRYKLLQGSHDSTGVLQGPWPGLLISVPGAQRQ